MNPTGQSRFNQARIEWAIRLRYSPMPALDMDMLASQLNAFRIGELRVVGKTWEVMFERDGELAVNAQKRYDDLAGREWKVMSDGSLDGDKHALALQYFYDHLKATAALDQDVTGKCDQLIAQAATAHSNYYSCHEMLLRVDNAAAKEVTAEFRHTPIWFFESRRGYLGYLQHIFDMYGQPCVEGEWLTVVGMGWMRPLSMAFAMKMFPMRDWLLYCERYGSGFLEGITDAQKDSEEWDQAREALRTIANDGVALHNRGVEFKFLEQAARNSLPFAPIVEKVDGLYAKCYRGVDLATGSRASGGAEGGNGAKNPVGASVQSEESGIFLLRDCKWLTGYFNERIDRPIIRYLFDEEPRAGFALMPPVDDNTAEDLAIAQGLVPMGLRIALKEVYQRFRWKQPQPGEPCLESPQSTVQGPQSEEDEPLDDESGETQRGDPTSTPGPPAGTLPPKGNVSPADDGQTIPAQTDDSTPIGAGADPFRNPQTSNPRLPDTQVDAAGSWSRAGLAPRGADGQTLPMPSLGYAIPNAIAGDAAARREYAAAMAHDMSHIWERLAKVAAINDDGVFEAKLRALVNDFDKLAADIKQDPAGQQVLQQILRQGFIRGVGDGAAMPALANGGSGSGNYGHSGRPGEIGGSNPGAGPSRPVNSLDALIDAAGGPGKAHYEFSATAGEAARVNDAVGIKTQGYKHRVEADRVRHFLSAHGEGKDSRPDGAQEPLSKEDLRRIPDIVAHFDEVKLSDQKSPSGQSVLIYSKRYNGTILYLEEVRQGKQILAAHSMRKMKAGLPGAKASGPTS